MPGKLVVISAPSGAGKTTIARHLLWRFPELAFSVSATTRPQRPEEQNGVDYFFITPEEFKRKVKNGDFIEWEEVYQGVFYGTLQAEMERIWQSGKTVLFDVDVRGALSLRNRFPDQTLAVFVKPPSYEILKERLTNRRTESATLLEERLRKATDELEFEKHFDCVILNRDLETAFAKAEDAVGAFLAAAS